MHEIKPPIALRGPLAEGDSYLRGVRCSAVPGFEYLLPGAVDLFFSHSPGADFLGCGDEDVAHFLEGIVARHFRIQAEKTRIVFASGKSRRAGGLLGLNERLVEPSRRTRAQNVCQHL